MPGHVRNLLKVRMVLSCKLLSVLGLVLLIPLVARGELIVDDDVVRLMLDQPDIEHSLVLSVALTRPPLDLQALLPTVDELNACTAKWQAWEALVKAKAAGEAVSDAEIATSVAAVKAYDAALRDKQEAAYAAYQEDYQAVVAESLQPVLAVLEGYFGDRVRWRDPHSQMVLAALDASEFSVLYDVPAIARVSYNYEFQPMLDVSRSDIRADLVHSGQGGVGPYTGAGVKVAIVDNGVRAGHARLPTVTEYDQCDFTVDPAQIGEGDDLCCEPHGTWVAGVVFCRDDPGDAFRGIAARGEGETPPPGATLVNARVWRISSVECGPLSIETWIGTDMPALHWFSAINAGAGARVINFSRGGRQITEGYTTAASDLTALNADHLVYTLGACFTHACGNIESGAPNLSPPSGAYNLFSVGGYDDGGTPARTDNVIWDGTSPGPTADPVPRRKPDLCAPGVDITTTSWFYDEPVFAPHTGTSFAAPHVAGVCALLLEARPSLNPRQIHAILTATCDFAPGQVTWDPKGGWGMLDAYRAVAKRNTLMDASVEVGQTKTYSLARPAAGEEVVVACAWQRRMVDEITPVPGSPAKLKLRLERRAEGGAEWLLVQDQAEDAVNNLHRVWTVQGPPGALYDYRIQVERLDAFAELVQEFTLASRHRLTTP